MERQRVIDSIKQVAKKTLPQGSSLFLYGSQAPWDAGLYGVALYPEPDGQGDNGDRQLVGVK